MRKRHCGNCKYGISSNDPFNFICENENVVQLYNRVNKTQEVVIDENTAKEYFPKGCPMHQYKKTES